jgi:putative transposase
MQRSRSSEEQVIGVLEAVGSGQKVAGVCREHGISHGTYIRWKAKFGGMDVSEARHLRELEEKNRRLEHAVADPTLGELRNSAKRGFFPALSI